MFHLYIRVVKTEAGLWSVSNSLDRKKWNSHRTFTIESNAVDHAFGCAVKWEHITGGTSGVTIDPREHKETSAYA